MAFHRLRRVVQLLASVSVLGLSGPSLAQDPPSLAPLVHATDFGSTAESDYQDQSHWYSIQKKLIEDQSVTHTQFGIPDDPIPAGDDSGGEAVELGTGPVPNVQGDFFDGGTRSVIFTEGISHSFHTTGFIQNGSPGDPNAFIIFERAGTGFPDDFSTAGPGTDSPVDANSHIDTFPITEPLAPNDVPTSPGAGFVFRNGTVVYTGTNDQTTPANSPFVDGGVWWATYDFEHEPMEVAIPAGGGLAVRRIKIAENNGVLPRHRVFSNFNFFNDVRGGYGDVSRYTFGYEMLAPGGLHSLEIRAPVAGTLATDQSLSSPGVDGFEWGNIVFTLKGLLYYDDVVAFSAGTGVALPTASDTTLSFFDGSPLLSINNESVHLLPFIAGLRAEGNYFLQGFMQFDFDLNGSPVETARPGNPLSRTGRIQDSSLLFLDIAGGVWLHRDRNSTVSSIAAVAELHYSTTLQDADNVGGNGILVTDLSNRFDILDVTLGTTTEFNNNLDIATGFVLPLRTGDDRVFDYEFLLQINRRF